MSDDVVRQFTPEQCEAGRAEIVAQMASDVGKAFAAYPGIRSAVMLVGQFWADEALDAVHFALAFSVSASPDLAAYRTQAEGLNDILFDPNADMDKFDDDFTLHDLWLEGRQAEERLSGKAWDFDQRLDFQDKYIRYRGWDSNGDAIPLFSAFCPEGADQEQPTGLSHAPYCVFRRGGTGVVVEIVGVKTRPWLEGVAPQGLEE